MQADGCTNMRNLLLLLAVVFVLSVLVVFAGAACFVIGAFIGWVSGTALIASLFTAAILAVIVKIGAAMVMIGLVVMAVAAGAALLAALIAVFAVPTYIAMGCTGAPSPAGSLAGFGNFGDSQLSFPFPPIPGFPPMPGLPPGFDPAKFLQCLAAASASCCNCGGTGGGEGKNSFADAWNMLQGAIAFLDSKRGEAEEKAAQLRSWIDQHVRQGGSDAAKTVEQARQQLSELEKHGKQFGEALNNARAAGGQMLSNAGKSLGFG